MAHEEGACRVWLAAELAQPRGDVDVQVRVVIEQAADEPEILGGTADVGADERGPRVGAEEPVEGRQQSSKRGHARVIGPVVRPGRPEVPVGMLVELLPALVRRIERLEECDRVRDMDHDRQAELGRGRPERVEPGVVDRHEPAVGVAGAQPERLPDLEATRPARGGVAEPGRLGLPEAGVACPAVESSPANTMTRPGAAVAQRSISAESASPCPPSRSTTASIPAASSAAISSSPERLAHSPPNAGPRWLWASIDRELRPRHRRAPAPERGAWPVVREAEVVGTGIAGGHSRPEDDDLAEVPGRVRVAATRQGERQREGMAGIEQQRQPSGRVHPAADEAHDPAGPAGLVVVACQQPGFGAEAAPPPRGRPPRPRPRDRRPGRRPACRARTPRSARGGTRAARTRSPGPGSSRSA